MLDDQQEEKKHGKKRRLEIAPLAQIAKRSKFDVEMAPLPLPKDGDLDIVNLVSTYATDTPLSLKALVALLPFVEYCPKTFAAAKLHLHPSTTSLVSSSAKAVCTGATDQYEAFVAIQRYAELVAKLTGGSPRVGTFTVVNMTATLDLDGVLDLPSLLLDAEAYATYDPTSFPCLFLYIDVEGKRVRHIASMNGIAIITGAVATTQVRASVEASRESLYAKHLYPKDGPEAKEILARAKAASKSKSKAPKLDVAQALLAAELAADDESDSDLFGSVEN